MIKQLLIVIVFMLSFFTAFSQPQPTAAGERLESDMKKKSLVEKSLLKNMEVSNVGPTVFSGRVSDISVNPADPSHFYVAYSSGGLWYTDNNGTSFEPVFDYEGVLTLGALDVDWNTGKIWLATGEVNSSRSSYSGNGIYSSTDKGETWVHHGLEDSHHIGRIKIDRENPNHIIAAVLGHLYSPSEERGIYRTTDGGATWNKVLYADENSGGIDLVQDPMNAQVWYAATWERERRAWNFVESGNGSGIYKSTDGGATWSIMTDASSGFPTGEGTGRIGIDVGIKDGKSVVYAILDNYYRRSSEEDEDENENLTKDNFRNMSISDFADVDDKKLSDFLKGNGFDKKYTADKVKSMVAAGELKPAALTEYLEDANSLLFDTPVIGAEIYISTDGGDQWKKTHDGYIDGLYNSYGYYFGQIRVDPADADNIYVMGVPILRSSDGGKTWSNVNGPNVHVDHHSLWINPNRSGHIINGNDGGINISYDHGENWTKCNSIPLGQFYYIAIDQQKPYNIYGGLQDNGVWKGPSTYSQSARWHNTGKYPYQSIMGGDGMQVQIDKRDNDVVYTGFQFGNYFRLNTRKQERNYITPKHKLGDRPYRWNWQSPILLSSHNPDIVYFGCNKLLRSMNQGNDFQEISGDLTKGGKKGDVAFGSLTTIDESTLQFGLIYSGSDDGKVYRTDNGGADWIDIGKNLPQDLWVSRIIASTHNVDRVYVVLNGYRWDHFKPYAYVSNDKGNTWTAIHSGLPLDPLNVIKEDPINENIIYIGSDHGMYISSSAGKSYMKMGNIPSVPVHDIVLHPENGDLLIGTHGRSIYKSNVNHLREILKGGLDEVSLHIMEPRSMRSSPRFGSQRAVYTDPFEPELSIHSFTSSAGEGTLIVMKGDQELNRMKVDVKFGFSKLTYDLSVAEEHVSAYETMLNKDAKEPIKLKKADNGKVYLKKGKYDIILMKDGNETKTQLKVR